MLFFRTTHLCMQPIKKTTHPWQLHHLDRTPGKSVLQVNCRFPHMTCVMPCYTWISPWPCPRPSPYGPCICCHRNTKRLLWKLRSWKGVVEKWNEGYRCLDFCLLKFNFVFFSWSRCQVIPFLFVVVSLSAQLAIVAIFPAINFPLPNLSTKNPHPRWQRDSARIWSSCCQEFYPHPRTRWHHRCKTTAGMFKKKTEGTNANKF